MPKSRKIEWAIGCWAAFLAVYAAISHFLGQGTRLAAFGDVAQCFVPLIANAGLLINAGTPHWRRNLFWMLMALSCTMWMIGQFQWTYYEVYLHKDVPGLFAGDMIFFLRGIPLMAALALRPDRKRGELNLGLGYLDFALLLTWWTFLYVYVVLPWIYASPTLEIYDRNYNLLANVQQVLIASGFAIYWLRTKGAWRTVYLHLFGASALYTCTSLVTNLAIQHKRYYTGSWYDLPLITVFFWYGLAGMVAFGKRRELDVPMDGDVDQRSADYVWATRFAMAAVLSLPIFALYALRLEQDTREVRDFRLLVTLIASLPLAVIVFLRTHLADTDRARLLARSESSIENLQRLQAQMVQSEKLVSLGELAAGAAHEINNPLSGILTYSRVVKRWIQNNFSSAPRSEEMTGSLDLIASESKRCGELVKNLLSFSRVTPMNLEWCELNQVIDRCIRLVQHKMDMATIQLNLSLGEDLPHVRCDPNQIEQVVLAMVINAIDALPQGGNLWINTRQVSTTNIELIIRDDGIGIPDEHLARIFEPFYTTKESGGSGLGLAISQNIVERHGGSIAVNSKVGQGTTFTILLPVDSQRVTLAADANRATAEPAPAMSVAGEVVSGHGSSRADKPTTLSSSADFSPRTSRTVVMKHEVEK